MPSRHASGRCSIRTAASSSRQRSMDAVTSLVGRQGSRLLRGRQGGEELHQPVLLVADTYPDALAGSTDALLRRRLGKAAFTFPRLDDDMARDLEALLARLYERYRADHVAA